MQKGIKARIINFVSGGKFRTEKLSKSFFNKINKKGAKGCWEWVGGKYRTGYGMMCVDKKQYMAHRVSWIFFNGKIKNNLQVCHHCDVRHCVNPKHLFLGTQKDNMHDMIKKGRGYQLPPLNWPAKMKQEKHHWQKLDRSDIQKIRKRLASGEFQRIIASDYDVDTDTIGKIHRGERWFHV